MTNFKKIIFRIYLFYIKRIKHDRGKYRIGKFIFKIFGRSIYKVNGIKIHLNPLPLIEQKLIRDGKHDPDVERIIAEKLNEEGIFIDIGANIGYFSLLAAKNNKIKVFAFEPSHRERKQFYKNLNLNNFNNIIIFPFALSNIKETLNLNIARDWNPGLNSIVNTLDTECVYVDKIQCYPFTDVFPKKLLNDIKLVKIDVEGFEMNVLKGMESYMQHMQNADFIVEINDDFLQNAGSSSKEIHDFFDRNGYKSVSGKSDITFTRIKQK